MKYNMHFFVRKMVENDLTVMMYAIVRIQHMEI